MLEQALYIAISTALAVIGSILGGFIISRKLKNDFKADIIEFLGSEDAPKLLYGFGQVFGKGVFSSAGVMNPMKGNVNIMGIKIPKVIAFGLAKKMGWLEGFGIPNVGSSEAVSPSASFDPLAQLREANR